MAVDMLVDSGKLDACCAAEAAAIIAKGGGTAPLAYDFANNKGFADAIAAIPSGGITPSGKKLITDTSETDVAAFATAQVSSDTLLAENIKKDVNILGVVGSFEGGGGGLPSSITKIDGGSFTLASDTDARDYSIAHSLGQAPKGFFIWTDDIVYGTSETANMMVNFLFKTVAYSATQSAIYSQTRKVTAGTFGMQSGQILTTALSGWVDSTSLKANLTVTLKADCTYKWIAWA